MKRTSYLKISALAAATLCGAGASFNACAEELNFIAPVSNPLFFEDANIATELRPLFIQHNIPSSFITGGGDARVYALELRYAVNDRLAIIATKDGFIEFNPKSIPKQNGWADLAGGVKYAVIKDADAHFLLTPGVKIEAPTGNENVFQGTGSGVWDLFVSSAKSWDRVQLQCNVGVTIPNDFSKKTSEAHYSLQLGYDACRWFKPFVSANAFTVLSNGKGLPLTVEGSDLINFGSSAASGQTLTALGGGFRSDLLEKMSLGVSAEAGVGNPKGLFDTRVIVDVSYRF